MLSDLTRYDGELREPLVWSQGSQGFMSVAEGARHCPRAGTVSPFRAEQGTSLETPSRARASSRVEVTRYDGELREPLVWSQGSQGFMSVAEGARQCPRVMVGESGLKMR